MEEPSLNTSENENQACQKAGRKNAILGLSRGFLTAGKNYWPVVLAAFLWSTSFVVTKEGVDQIPPITFGAVRFLIASFVLLAVAGISRKVEKVKRGDLTLMAVGGLLGITAYFSLQNLGIQRTSASEATLLVASFPAVTMLMESLIFKKKTSWLRYAGVGIAFLGIYLVINHAETGQTATRLEGDVFLMATGLVWAFYNFITHDVVQRHSPLTVIFWQTLFGTLFFLPLVFFEMGSWKPVNAGGIFQIVYLAVFCSIIAYLLYSFGLQKTDSSTAVSLLNLVPLFGLIIAALALHEEIGMLQILGGVLVIGGVMVTVPKKEP